MLHMWFETMTDDEGREVEEKSDEDDDDDWWWWGWQ